MCSDSIVEGFDLEPFRNNRIVSSFGFHYNGHLHVNLTEPTAIFQFDFEQGILEPEDKDVYAKVINDGSINAVAMWWDLWVDEETLISTGNGNGMICFDN